MATLHPLLERQLKRSGCPSSSPPATQEAWQQFLERLSQTYHQVDQDRYLLERSMSISSQEMQTVIAERQKADEALQKAHEKLTVHTQRLERVNELFRAMVDQLTLTIRRGATSKELLDNLRLLQREYERLDQHNLTGNRPPEQELQGAEDKR